MRPHVPLQHAFICELFIAHVTFELFVACVATHVAVVVRFDRELFATDFAEVLPELRVGVHYQLMGSKIKKTITEYNIANI